MATDVRFWRPNTIVRQENSRVLVSLEFYRLYTESTTELAAYNAAGQRILGAFASQTLQANFSATLTVNGWVSRKYTHAFYFASPSFASQAVSFHAWVYSEGWIKDYV